MERLKIGIVEDEVLIADNIAMHLQDMEHQITGVAERFEDVIEQMKQEVPDLFLIDIRLKGTKSGLDVARQLMERYGVPFMFLTSNTDKATVKKAMETLPLGYITKPFSFEDLYIAIELAKAKIQLGAHTGRKVEIKNGTDIEWIAVKDILYLEAARSYVTVMMKKGSLVLRQSMGQLLELFTPTEMARIHRSFAVNPHRVESVSSSRVIINGVKLPLGPKHRDDFLQWMREID